MPTYNEQISNHLPQIHDDTYTWESFSNILKRGEYEEDKIYFIQNIDTSAAFIKKLTEELLEAKNELERLLNSDLEENEGGE